MRVVVEALGADFGGIRTYVDNLLRGWSEAFAEDELLVLVDARSSLESADHEICRLRVPSPRILGRPFEQTRREPGIVRSFGADAVLATMPATSLGPVGAPTALVVHDLRHELRPEQFSRSRRVIRKVAYSRAYALADGFVAVSRRTLDDLHALHPATRAKPAVVAHHGADHVLRWPGSTTGETAVTFAHHSNKNTGLVLEAWAAGRAGGLALPPLLMLGAGADRDRLERRIAELGLGSSVSLAAYLPEAEFARAMASASMIVFPSDFEGFGLPIVEGMLLRKPVVIGPDRACVEVAGGHAVQLEAWTADALARAVAAATTLDDRQLGEAHRHAEQFTWRRAAQHTRGLLEQLTAPT